MATFPSIAPDYGLTKESAPTIRRVQFGDGYEQRIRWGINQNPKKWSITWTNITNAETQQIEDFLDARANDGDFFDWTPPDSATSNRWVCEQWDKSMTSYNRNTVQATFRQVFDL